MQELQRVPTAPGVAPPLTAETVGRWACYGKKSLKGRPPRATDVEFRAFSDGPTVVALTGPSTFSPDLGTVKQVSFDTSVLKPHNTKVACDDRIALAESPSETVIIDDKVYFIAQVLPDMGTGENEYRRYQIYQIDRVGPKSLFYSRRAVAVAGQDPSCLFGRHNLHMSHIGHRLFVFSSLRQNKSTLQLEIADTDLCVLDLDTGMWVERRTEGHRVGGLTSDDRERRYHCLVSFGGRIYSFGIFMEPRVEINVLDPETCMWSQSVLKLDVEFPSRFNVFNFREAFICFVVEKPAAIGLPGTEVSPQLRSANTGPIPNPYMHCVYALLPGGPGGPADIDIRELRLEGNAPTYILWPIRWVVVGDRYIWGVGSTEVHMIEFSEDFVAHPERYLGAGAAAQGRMPASALPGAYGMMRQVHVHPHMLTHAMEALIPHGMHLPMQMPMLQQSVGLQDLSHLTMMQTIGQPSMTASLGPITQPLTQPLQSMGQTMGSMGASIGLSQGVKRPLEGVDDRDSKRARLDTSDFDARMLHPMHAMLGMGMSSLPGHVSHPVAHLMPDSTHGHSLPHDAPLVTSVEMIHESTH